MHIPVPPSIKKANATTSLRTQKIIQKHVSSKFDVTPSPPNMYSKHSLENTYHSLSRRIVPPGSLAHGTWFSEYSDFFDLASVTSYYNWKYKLFPRLPGDQRPIWK